MDVWVGWGADDIYGHVVCAWYAWARSTQAHNFVFLCRNAAHM